MSANPSAGNAHHHAIIAATMRWLEQAVIGLNLCPFAKAVHVKHQIRYVVSSATSAHGLLDDLQEELHRLGTADASVIDTTLLIHPDVLGDFLEYNNFLREAEGLLKRQGLRGHIQIASFHSHYQFADMDKNAIENYTNRSPYPMLHLLRETSVERAIAAFPDAAKIYETNMQTMTRLGIAGWQALGLGSCPTSFDAEKALAQSSSES